ncbi:MAG: hypothetical protein R3308_00840 [Thiohalobacterales bacterium]|nr:hypothetical protein [Thiohalobacterales bacterium]
MNEHDSSRRKFVKKLVYMPPAIASLTVLPAFHASGSGYVDRSDSPVFSNDTGAWPGSPGRPDRPGNNGR